MVHSHVQMLLRCCCVPSTVSDCQSGAVVMNARIAGNSTALVKVLPQGLLYSMRSGVSSGSEIPAIECFVLLG
jgi:hypothetical protein